MFRFVRFLLFSVGLSFTSLSQNPSNTGNKPDPIALLTEVRQKYANIKTYRIEAVLESVTAGEFSRNWNKSYLNAAVASGNRYRFEGRAQGGWILKISDGKTEWMVDRDASLYTQKPAPERGPTQIRMVTINLLGLASAQNLLRLLAGQPGRVLDPAYLPDETLTLNGQRVPCYVITGRGRYSGGPPDASWQLTFWIEKERHVIRKVHGHGEGAMIINAPYYRVVEDETTVYSVADLDPSSLPDPVFQFDPPAEAKLVDELPDPMKTRGIDLVGKAAPDVKLHSAKGETVALASFRGKPVLLDFWSPW
jgi:AhpC/TSA family